MRTDDLTYGQDYWDSLDSGAGYKDSVMWEDLSFITKEVLYYGPGGEDLSNTHNLLDVGCAYGFLVRHLRRRGVEAWGIDISEFALKSAPDDISTYLRQHDITKDNPYTFAGFPFARLACFETLEHIPEEDVMTALACLFGALKQGGVALLTICTDNRPGWETDPTHVTIKPRSWWYERLKITGFVEDDRSRFLNQFHLFKHHSGVFVLNKP